MSLTDLVSLIFTNKQFHLMKELFQQLPLMKKSLGICYKDFITKPLTFIEKRKGKILVKYVEYYYVKYIEYVETLLKMVVPKHRIWVKIL